MLLFPAFAVSNGVAYANCVSPVGLGHLLLMQVAEYGRQVAHVVIMPAITENIMFALFRGQVLNTFHSSENPSIVPDGTIGTNYL